jgi:hypothetical protein
MYQRKTIPHSFLRFNLVVIVYINIEKNRIETDKGKCPLCLGAADVSRTVEITGKD